MRAGYPIVLTADRTLIANYDLLFDGMLAASQTTLIPYTLMRKLLMPPAASQDGRASVAPLGLRRIEAALLRDGFSPEEVAVVTPEEIDSAIGAHTRIVAISSGEPAGQGMNTSTMTEILGGDIYPQVMFRMLLRDVQRGIAQRAPRAKIVLGGPGVWQVARSAKEQQALGIDHLLTGYVEGNVAALFRRLLNGEELPPVCAGEGVTASLIPCIRAASSMGVVEISRGCGLGCHFCTLGHEPMQHLPLQTILSDVQTNIRHGHSSIAALSEDFFRYGGHGTTVNPPALLHLLTALRQVEGLRLIQLDHANIISIAQFSDAELRQVHDALVGDSRHDFPWVNIGVETASGRLLYANGCTVKMGGCTEEAWGVLCAEHLRRVCRAGFFPLVSLMVGLPGETEEDVQRTMTWVHGLSEERLAIFPVLYAPLDGKKGKRARDLTKQQWRLLRACYEINFRWIPRLYWDNQTGAGVPFAKKMLLQGMGRGQVLLWRTLFAWHTQRATR
jgi:radical SAM superfamily enzyme YgiQ (UPF0313 family)